MIGTNFSPEQDRHRMYRDLNQGPAGWYYELKIRRGEIPPSTEEEQQWAREGWSGKAKDLVRFGEQGITHDSSI